MKRQRTHEGFTLIELLIVVAIIGVIAAIAIPGLLRARMVANETSAVSSLRAISTAQTSYSSVCGRSGYATGMVVLAFAPGGVGAPFLSDDMTAAAIVSKSGFWLTMNGAGLPAGGADCNGRPTATGYYASATPMGLGSTGSRAFAVGHPAVIYFAIGAVAPDPPHTGTSLQ